MPELPEVEVTRRGLARRLPGALVLDVRLGKPLRWPLGVEAAALTGHRLGLPARRGKYIWLPLLAPEQPASASHTAGLLLHLGMSGTLTVLDEATPPGPHDHFDLHTTQGLLRLHDPRRFGAVVWSPALDQPPAARLLATLGPEPLEPGFHARGLHAALRGRRMAIKQALLAGDAVVGVGNIYCSEALHQAGIDPRTPGARLSLARCERLAAAIRDVLGRAVALGGSTLRDFHDAQGQAGAFQDAAQVYGRAGQPCRRCDGMVRRIVQGQRATYFCPSCQHR